MGYPGGRNAYANGMGPQGFFGTKLGTGFGQANNNATNQANGVLAPTMPISQMSMKNLYYSPDLRRFAKGGSNCWRRYGGNSRWSWPDGS